MLSLEMSGLIEGGNKNKNDYNHHSSKKHMYLTYHLK